MKSFSRALCEQQQGQSVLVERLVSGKLNRQQFVDQEAVIVRKRDEAKDKISAVCAQLRAI